MYKIQITSNNPEFDVPGPFENGYYCDGYLLIPFNDGEDDSVSVVGTNVMMMADAFSTNPLLMQAVYIAEGIVKARKYKKENAKNELMDMLLKVRDHEDDDEDEEDD